MSDAESDAHESRSSGAPFELADWLIDPASGTLTHGDRAVRLEPKVMEVLLELASRPGEVLSKEQLITAVWRDSFVGEAALSRCISELRRALGDDARAPRYIETLPKRGYRLLVNVGSVRGSTQASTGGQPTPDESLSPSVARRAHRPAPRLLLATAIMAALVSAWWILPRPATSPREIESIAVLPLRALSDDAEQRFFAAGLSNQLVTQLAVVPTLRVISGLAAQQARDAGAPLRTIAASLGVDAVVDGTVRQSANRTLVSLELAHGNGDVVWAGTYQETSRDPLELGQEVAVQAAREIRFALTLRQGATDPPRLEVAAARQALDRGRRLASRGTPVDAVRSLEEFRQALAIDPDYAEAWAALAGMQATLGWNNWSDPAAAYAEARAAAYAALDRDPQTASAHAVLAAVAAELNQDWPEAEREFRIALQLDPRSPVVLERYGRYLRRLGDTRAALEQSELAVTIDGDTAPVLLGHAQNLLLSGEYEAALDFASRALELDSVAGQGYAVLCAIQNLQERYEEALSTCNRAAAAPGHDLELGAVGYAYARAGEAARAVDVLDELEGSGNEAVTALAAATVRLGLGETDAALTLLELAAERRSLRLAAILEDPYLRQLRHEPRFDALLVRMALPRRDDR